MENVQTQIPFFKRDLLKQAVPSDKLTLIECCPVANPMHRQCAVLLKHTH